METPNKQLEAAERNRREERMGAAPTTVDARNIDPEVGLLLGEGSEQLVVHPDRAFPIPDGSRRLPVSPARTATPGPTYYDMPMLKQSVWRWYIPAYFYVGGAAGAAAVIAGASQLSHGRALRGLITRAHAVGTTGLAVSAALLIADLGKPARFIYMMRVFRPSSPMNLGTWVLNACGAATSVAALAWHRQGLLGRASRVAGYGAALMGMPLATYTAVLVSDTAVPLWQGSRRTLPFLFAASALTSATALIQLAGTAPVRRLAGWVGTLPVLGTAFRSEDRREAHRPPLSLAPSRREDALLHILADVGKVAELAGMVAVRRELAPIARRPLETGATGMLWRVSAAAALVGLGLGRFARVSRTAAIAGGLVSSFGALALRFAIIEGGKRSARDPRASFEPQRASLTEQGRMAIKPAMRSGTTLPEPQPTLTP